MNDEELDMVRSVLDDSVLNFTADSADEMEISHNGEGLASWRLSEIVDGLLESMQSPRERDDMLALADHFAGLARRIRRVIADVEAA